MKIIYSKFKVLICLSALVSGCGNSDITLKDNSTVSRKSTLGASVQLAHWNDASVQESIHQNQCAQNTNGVEHFSCEQQTIAADRNYLVHISQVPVQSITEQSGLCRLVVIEDSGELYRAGSWTHVQFDTETVINLSQLGLQQVVLGLWGNQNLRLYCVASGTSSVTYHLKVDIPVVVRLPAPQIDFTSTLERQGILGERHFKLCVNQQTSFALERHGQLSMQNNGRSTVLVSGRLDELNWHSVSAGQCLELTLQPGERAVYWWGPTQVQCLNRNDRSADCNGVDLVALIQILGQGEVNYDQAEGNN